MNYRINFPQRSQHLLKQLPAAVSLAQLEFLKQGKQNTALFELMMCCRWVEKHLAVIPTLLVALFDYTKDLDSRELDQTTLRDLETLKCVFDPAHY